MRNRYAILCGCLLLFADCKFSSGKQKLLQEDTMKVIMWDLLKADELFIRNKIKDSTAEKRRDNIRMYEEVFAIHHTTKREFDSSFKYYEAHPVIFKQLIDSLDTYATREKFKLTERHGQAQPVPTKDSSVHPFKSAKLK